MPYISSTTAKKMTDAQKEAVKKKLAQAMLKIAGKGEEWLMINFQDGTCMYFKGQGGDEPAFVDVKLVGSLTSSQKKELSAEIGNIYQSELGIPVNKIYIVFSEVSGSNWGWNGGTFG